MNHYEEEAEETLHASIRDVVRGAIEAGHLEPQVGAEMSRALLADARALWSVRVLDAWATANPSKLSPATSPHPTREDVLGWCTTIVGRTYYGGPTPDAARHAAALAVFASLPADVRQQLGECP